MGESSSESVAAGIMVQFADRTGLSPGKAPRRYLWTDAFAACNFLGLHNEMGDEKYRDLAVHLIDQVHHALGWHRQDDRHGYLGI